MATFSGINNTTTLDPGFAFDTWNAGINAAMAQMTSVPSVIETNPDNWGLNADGSLYANWYAAGVHLWGQGSISQTGVISLTDMDVSLDSGMSFGFMGKATIDANGILSTVQATEIWIESSDGYTVDYQGTLNFNVATGIISGSVKSIYLVAENGDAPGDAYYMKLSGGVTLDANGDFSAGTVKSVEWGTVTFGDNNPTFTVEGTYSGLKINATYLEGAFSTEGFDGLMQFVFSGNDTISGTDAGDTLFAGAGNDKVYGLAGDDFIKGQAGNDTLEGGLGADTMNGGIGNDKMYGYAANDIDNVTDSGDTMNGWDGNDSLYGGAGNDSMNGGAGSDKIYGGDGNDSIGGDINPAHLAALGLTVDSPEYTTFGSDKIYAGAGNDSVNGGGGNDQIFGQDGDDTLYGDRSTDPAEWAGNDKIDGGAGNDFIAGGGGNDQLLGGDGNDILIGGAGNDSMTGGAGMDYFVFNGPVSTAGSDTIKDFVTGTDKLWFDLDTYTALNGITASNFTTNATGDADDVLIYTGGKLYYDADANGAAAPILIATVKNLQFSDIEFGHGLPSGGLV